MATLDDIKRKKKHQANLSYASSSGALAGGALLGASALIRRPKVAGAVARGSKALKLKAPDLSTDETRNAFAQKVKDKGYVVSGLSGAIGGVGGLNFASIQRDESKLRRPATQPNKKPRV